MVRKEERDTCTKGSVDCSDLHQSLDVDLGTSDVS
jgi:hypothetical protein